MADSSVASKQITLIDNWPTQFVLSALPDANIVSTNIHNTSAQIWPLGSKIMLYNDPAQFGTVTSSLAGFSTFIYLKGHAITETPPAQAPRQFVVQAIESEPFRVTNDPENALIVDGTPLTAVLLTVMTFTHTTAKYGWFWCGGVCPISLAPLLTGTIGTAVADVVIGNLAVNDLAADSIGVGVVGADTEAIVGFTDKDDT